MPFFGHLLWCYSGASVFLASMPHLWFMYHAMLRMLYDLIMYICDYIYAHYYYTCLVHICCRYCRHHVVLVAKTQQLCWHAQQLWDNAQCSNQKYNMSIMSVLQWCDVWNHRWQGLDMLLLVHRDATLELCTTIAWSAKDSIDLEAIEHENCNGSTSSWVQQTKTQVDSYFFGTLRKSLWMVGLSGCLLALIAISWDTTERCAWTISLSDLWYVISILWNAPQ